MKEPISDLKDVKAIGRRRLLRLGMLSAAWWAIPGAGLARAALRLPMKRSVRFYNLHTGESLSTVYWEKGTYVQGALKEIWHLLRDFRTGEIKPIDSSLLDLVNALGHALDTREPFQVISGYRSPATNAMLRSHSEGVALHSLHMVGKAVDIRVPGRELRTVRQAAVALRSGGVGYYPRSDFVHVDVGRVRYW